MREQNSFTISEETIKAAREGDLAAFEGIVTFFEGRLFGYVSRMISNREDAEDIVQDVFIKIYKKIGSYNPEQSFKTWVYAIATNTVYDFLRAKRVKKELLTLDDDVHPFETEDPSDTYQILETSLDLELGLAKIKPAYRTIVLLFYKEELSCEQIAEMLTMPVGTVKTNLFRARKALRDAFQQ